MATAVSNLKAALQRVEHSVFQWLLRCERQQDQVTTRLILLASIGCVGLPLYYVTWAFWFPQEYESVGLRLIGTLLCMPALFARHLLSGRALRLYLFAGVTYVIPFFFTFMYLMNHASAVWSQSLLVALIVLFHFDTRWAFCSYLVGSALAYLTYALIGDAHFLSSQAVLQHLPIHLFAILVVSTAKVGRRVLAQEKLAGMAQGLASVSHELRTPLVSVDANVRGMNRMLARTAPSSERDAAAMSEALARIQFEVRHMNHMIDLFLLSATAVRKPLAPTEHLSMQMVVDAVIRRYPFVTQCQRDAVAVDVRGDFTFAGQSELCVVVLLNLLRNALKALHRAGKGRIRILIDGAHATPRLLFIDTGCGIEARQLPLIFRRFYSYPASAGSGIGLALCKEIVEAWQARIRCVSRELAYTVFILEFPTHVQLTPAHAAQHH